MSKSISGSASRPRFRSATTVFAFAVVCLALIFSANFRRAAAVTLMAAWGFEGVTTTNTGQTPIIGGSSAADSGALTTGSAFTGFHTSASTVWSNPAGNGSTKSVSSDHWGIGDYYQFLFSTSA